MRILRASTVVGSFLMIGLIGTLPAVGQSTPRSATPAQTASVLTSDRDTYVKKAREEIQQWQLKLNDFSEKTRAKATDANTAALKDFNAAWTEADAATQKLETAGAADWDSAKSSFKKASQKLAAVWQRIKTQV